MTIITLFCNLFGLEAPPLETRDYYCYADLAYGEHERQKIDLYIPKNTDGEAGLILMIHGGAWVGGDKSAYSEKIKEWAEKGYAAATVNYRYLSYEIGFDDILDDIESALHLIKEKGEEKGVNISKMLLSGHSAGGHLSMLYAYSRKNSSPIAPVAVVNDSGPTDMTDPNFYNENATDDLRNLFTAIASLVYGEELTIDKTYLAYDKLREMSPINYIDADTVPTVINHGMKDDIVPYSNAVSLDAKLTECGVTHIMNPYPNSGHSLESDPESSAKASEYFAEYVDNYLK